MSRALYATVQPGDEVVDREPNTRSLRSQFAISGTRSQLGAHWAFPLDGSKIARALGLQLFNRPAIRKSDSGDTSSRPSRPRH
jgi:hypothetical protein